MSKLQAGDIGLELAGTLEDARILDHLTPNIQRLLAEARKYQRQHNYRFSWMKNYERMNNQIQYKLIRSTTWKIFIKLETHHPHPHKLKLSSVCEHVWHHIITNFDNVCREHFTNCIPFNHLDDCSFNLVHYELAHGTMNYTNDLFETLLFNPTITSSFTSNLDPDNNLSVNLPVSEYTVEDGFADKTASLNINLTLIYLNARSLLGNFDNFK